MVMGNNLTVAVCVGAALSRFTIERGAHADFYFLTDIETQCALQPAAQAAPAAGGAATAWSVLVSAGMSLLAAMEP